MSDTTGRDERFEASAAEVRSGMYGTALRAVSDWLADALMLSPGRQAREIAHIRAYIADTLHRGAQVGETTRPGGEPA